MIYLFDIDGTLTPSRLRIDAKFEQFFLQWMKDKEVIFVTGSDKEKTIEQVGEKIWTNASRVYQSCGNAVYQGGQLIHKNQFDLDPELKTQIQKAFLELEDEAILKPFKADGFKSVTDQDYDVIRNLGKVLELNFSQDSK